MVTEVLNASLHVCINDDSHGATLGYGVGNWYMLNGQENKAREIFERVTNGPYWPAFGFIAAEADLARLGESRP